MNIAKNDSAPAHQALYSVLKNFDTAMMVVRTDEGTMRACPMHIAQMQPDADAYFVVHADSVKLQEIQAHRSITLTFQSNNQFVSLTGIATLVHDAALIDQLWSEAWKLWFPKGKTDPAITLVQFAAREGEYWDNAGWQGFKYVFNAAKAYVSGQTAQSDTAQHAKVIL